MGAPGSDSQTSVFDVYAFVDYTFSNKGGSVVQVAPFDVVGVDVSLSEDNEYIVFLQIGEEDAIICVYTFNDDTESWTQLLDCVPYDVES